MPTRASKTRIKRPQDSNLLARSVIEDAIGEKWEGTPLEHPPERVKNPHAQALSALGASKGGKARAESLTAKQRSKIAKKAAKARWKNKPEAA